MKNHLKKCLIGVSILTVFLFVSGCQHQPEASEAAASEAASQEAESTAIPAPTDSDSLSLSFTIINHCGVDIGMFSVIDPRTGDQFDLGGIGNDEALTTTANWPKSSTQFQWALYNQNGDLSVESSTDISAAKTSVTLTLTGDGDLDDVEESFE